MDSRTADRLTLWLLVIVALVALYDGVQVLQSAQVNRALARIEAGETVDAQHPTLDFARAYAMQQAGEFEAALQAYAAIDAAGDPVLQGDIHYNLANLYLRRAFGYRDEEAHDLALPLVELAKEYYRELLRRDSERWAARYNLELALKIAPETDPEPVEEERNPEHNPRSAAGIQVRKPLP